MLNPKDLTEILGQANSTGVMCTLLINQHGSLVAFVGNGDVAAKVKGTVCSSIWSGYEHKKPANGSEILLSRMIISCANGNVVVEKAGQNGLLLCMFAELHVSLGLLSAKAKAIIEFLEEPLSSMREIH